eukprot:8667315-Prorocentrum_lima.AAC.1
MFLDELRKCGAMRSKLEYYDTLDENHPDKSYKWVVTQVQRYLEKRRLDDKHAQRRSHWRRIVGPSRVATL